jgi:hypothetical protein
LTAIGFEVLGRAIQAFYGKTIDLGHARGSRRGLINPGRVAANRPFVQTRPCGLLAFCWAIAFGFRNLIAQTQSGLWIEQMEPLNR